MFRRKRKPKKVEVMSKQKTYIWRSNGRMKPLSRAAPARRPSLQWTRLRESGLVDTFRALHPDAGQVGTFNGFKGDTCGEKIDAVLVSPGWSVLGAAIDRTRLEGRYPSDHFPVTAILGYPQDAADPAPPSGGP